MKLPSYKEYPKFIYIKDEKYEVRMVKRLPRSRRNDHGMCDEDKKIIWVRSTQSPKGLFRTFIHEVLHAASFEWDCKLEHKHINPLELALEAILTDNY